MAKVVVVYGTTEGHTRRVAKRAAARLRAAGLETEVHDATALEGPVVSAGLAGVLIAASVHHRRHQAAVTHFIHTNLERLRQLPTAFISVSLTAALPDATYQDEARSYVNELLDATGWRPDATLRLAGALKYAEYDFFKRLLLGLLERRLGAGVVGGEDAEFTDWEALDRFVDAFAARLGAGTAATPARAEPS